MRTSLRRTACAAVVASLSLLATACGGSDSSGKDASGDKPAVTHLTLWAGTKGSREIVEAFNKSHKDIQVKLEEVPDNDTKIPNAVKAGNAPDIAVLQYNQLPKHAAQGELEDISAQVGETVKAKFPESVRQLVTLGDKVWGVPNDAGVMVMFYRKDLFEKYGIEVPKTWDDFKAAAEKVKKADKSLSLAPANLDANLITAMCWQAGATWFSADGGTWKVDIDNEISHKVADYWDDLADRKLLDASEGEALTKQKVDGRILTEVSGIWAGGYMKTGQPDQSGKWAVAPLPTWDRTPASAMFGGTSFVVPEGAKNVDAAVEFITWATTTPEAVKARLAEGTSSTLPANPELAEAASSTFDPAYFGGQDIHAVAREALKTMPSDWAYSPTATTDTRLADAMGKVKAGDIRLSEIFAPAETATVADLKNRGLKVAQ
ncbi:ABC transporter substrate-binding protein [Streptomyces sp. FIT100]|uniref:ABC transporter substrate-binding protein n=1 Tax=Streptomyces sp. FIT100 TaxID=2837956 RepID=UPI0021CA0A41|nr:extracellular solute-binding protein [Streptomyces sp. FIT100]UUN29786.1 extracellular solute-binding protein [Streptomyces sp. FIT100]